MPEAFNPDKLMRPRNLQTAATMDTARDEVRALLATSDGDELADRLERIASDSDLAHAALFLLLMEARGVVVRETGIQMVADSYRPGGLVIP